MNDRRSNQFFVYTLFSLKDKKLYTGFTTNLHNRLDSHQNGDVESTAHRRPLILIHYESFITEEDARAREIFLKSGFRRSNLKKAIKQTLLELNG